MQYSLNELRQNIFSKVYDVYAVFQNYFGEEHTDLQNLPTDNELLDVMESWDVVMSEHEGIYEAEQYNWNQVTAHFRSLRPQIIVWWPEVTVSNEHNRSVKIQDLFAQIELTMDGTIPMENHGFKLNRTTFNRIQAASGYMHSHLPSHFDWSHAPSYTPPCLGRGPIKGTIVSLKTDNSDEVWMLFCNELDLYVTVESLDGGPYRKLEELGNTKKLLGYNGYSLKDALPSYYYDASHKDAFFRLLTDFTKYYLTHGHLTLSYNEGKFCAGIPYYDYMIDISNSFIEWFNINGNEESKQQLLNKKALIEVTIRNGQFYTTKKLSIGDVNSFNGQYVLTFKNRDVNLLITDDHDSEETPISIILNHDIAMFLLYNILKIINYRYTNEHTKQQGDKESSPINQTVYYI